MSEKELLIENLKTEFKDILSTFHYDSLKEYNELMIKDRQIIESKYYKVFNDNYKKAIKKLVELE